MVRTTASFQRHSPRKDARNNPIIRETEPWEDRLHMFGSVVQLSPTSLRLYYLIDGEHGLYNCVAESTDSGATWRKDLNLGMVAFPLNSSNTNNNIYFATPPQHGEHYTDFLAWVGLVPSAADAGTSASAAPPKYVAAMETPSWLTSQLPDYCKLGTRDDAVFLLFSDAGRNPLKQPRINADWQNGTVAKR